MEELNIHPFDTSTWRLAHGRSLELGPKAVIMGILNVTPDSFSDGGQHWQIDSAVNRAREMAKQGASIVDIGGESTKPGSEVVDEHTEQARVLPVIERLRDDADIVLSVDTYRSSTARLAIEAGAHIVNDVWGCHRDPHIAKVAADTGAGLVIMNMRRERSVLSDLPGDAVNFLTHSLRIADEAGVEDDSIVLDPGIGFATVTDHDIPLLKGLKRLHHLGKPLLIGTSRKRFLGEITGREPADRDVATAATSVLARQKGAAIFRVHDISKNKDALAVTDAFIHNAG